MYKKQKVALFCSVWKKMNTNGINTSWHDLCGYGIFFLASDYRWFMGARRYFALDVRIFPPDQSSFSLYQSEKLHVWINKLLYIIVLFNRVSDTIVWCS